jgi:hypothetical protein
VTELNRHEAAWLDQRHHQAEREAREGPGPSRSLRGRIEKACDRWATDAVWIATGLNNATATLPPPARQTSGRRGSGPSDPTAAVIGQTYDTVQREAEAFAHLTGRCALDGTREHDRCCGRTVRDGCKGHVHTCPDTPASDLPGLSDPATVVDGLLGTPASSPTAFSAATGGAAAWHAAAAVQTLSAWREAWTAGREPSELEDWCVQVEMLQRRLSGLAGRLADWSGRRERKCRACDGVKPEDRATCGRCRTRAWRDRQVTA